MRYLKLTNWRFRLIQESRLCIVQMTQKKGVAVFGRCILFKAFKNAHKIFGIVIADFAGNLLNGKRTAGQQAFRLLNAETGDLFPYTDTHHILVFPGEVTGIIIEFCGYSLQRNLLTGVDPDPFLQGLQLARIELPLKVFRGLLAYFIENTVRVIVKVAVRGFHLIDMDKMTAHGV